MEEFSIVQKVETVNLVDFINRKKKLHQRLILSELESLDINDPEYATKRRKVILDHTNEFSRSVVRTIFGDSFEGYVK
jgi:hypothetical protein